MEGAQQWDQKPLCWNGYDDPYGTLGLPPTPLYVPPAAKCKRYTLQEKVSTTFIKPYEKLT